MKSAKEDLTFKYVFIPESCTKYHSEALQAVVDSWCKIQVIHQDTSPQYPLCMSLRYA
jgi:hypothetical protein